MPCLRGIPAVFSPSVLKLFMNPTRILPDLQSSLLCEEVRQEANGNFFLIGVVTLIRVPQLPIVAARL